MTAPLALLLAVTAAYLAAHVLVDWLALRFLVVSGAEYLALGVLLGPQLSGLFSAPVLASLTPVATLALGWIGAIVGMQFDVRQLILRPAREFRIAFTESLLTLAVVAGLELLVLRLLFDDASGTLGAAITLGAMAVASSQSGIALMARVGSVRGPTLRQLELSTAVNAFVAIVVFGLLLAIDHPSIVLSGAVPRALTPTEWAVVSVAVGVVGGALFHVFVGETPDDGRLFIALAGGVILVSGAATYLRVSALMSAMFFGIVLANTTADATRLTNVMRRVEAPFYFVLLLLGGALWAPSQHEWIAPVALFLAARAAGKIGGARLATRANDALGELGGQWGRALLGPGRVTLAIGVSYLTYGLAFRDIVFTAAVVSIFTMEFLSARAARAVLPALPPPPEPSPMPTTSPV